MTDEERSSIDLEDVFTLYHRPSKSYRLKLSSSILSIQPSHSTSTSADQSSQRPTYIIPIDDLYGCLFMKSSQSLIQCHLVFYLYALKRSKNPDGTLSNKGPLQRSEKIFTYDQFEDFQSNLKEVTRWHRAVTQAIYLRRHLPLDIVTCKRDKPVLVFVNPAGGAGKAYRLVMEYVVGVWGEAEFRHHIIVTEYAGHARDFVQTIELSNWSGIVLASGDGLVFEVINGLMSRPDWRNAMQLPIGHLPGGSGNAFITNILHHSKQPIPDTLEKFIVQAAVLIARHDVIPFDLAIIDICDRKRLFSFLCIEWGIIADVDCDSEQYRFLGEARFTVEALKRILQPRVYHGYIDYIPYENPAEARSTTPSIDNVPIAQLHQYLPPINEPVPLDPDGRSPWRRIEGPFAHVLITSKQCISRDVIAAPRSTLADGYLTLQFIRAAASTRMNLAKTFTKLSDGSHFDYDFVERMAIRAFRIVPNDRDGNLMVDGEKVAFGPIQGEILTGVGKCMGRELRTDVSLERLQSTA